MVTHSQQEKLLIGPGWAAWLVVLTIIACVIAWAMAHSPHQGRYTAYDLSNPHNLVEPAPAGNQVDAQMLDRGASQRSYK